MATKAGDIQLDGKDYLLAPRGYTFSESAVSGTRAQLSDPSERKGTHWGYFTSSDWIGMGRKLWLGDGPFLDGYGLDLSEEGQVNIANALAQTQADANNTGGYVAFADGTTRVWFMGKTNGTSYYSANLSSWTSLALGAGGAITAAHLPTSMAFLKGSPYVATSAGSLWSLSGTTFTEKTTKPLSTAAYALGAYKGKVWIGYANALYNYTGSAWSTEQFAGFVDGTPITGAVGNSVLYFVTAGPNARVYMTDGNQLHHIASYNSDFLPKRAIFLETLYIFGHASDDSSTPGDVWRLEESGMVPVFQHGNFTADFGIRDAALDGDRILWGANRKTGIGIFDPALDIYEDEKMGYYVGPTITTVTGAVHGIAQFAGSLVCGIEGQGIYKEGTPGAFEIVSSRYDGGAKNINKLWGEAEINHSKLLAGQKFTLSTSKDDGTTYDEWGSSSSPETKTAIIPPPETADAHDYKNPFLQYKLTGDAAGSDLTLFDLTLANLETPDNPKRVWDLLIVTEGSDDEPMVMRDDTPSDRTSVEQLADLVGLWNKRVLFEDIDGSEYQVICKVPRVNTDDIVKDVAEDGSLDELVSFYRIRLVEL